MSTLNSVMRKIFFSEEVPLKLEEGKVKNLTVTKAAPDMDVGSATLQLGGSGSAMGKRVATRNTRDEELDEDNPSGEHHNSRGKNSHSPSIVIPAAILETIVANQHSLSCNLIFAKL